MKAVMVVLLVLLVGCATTNPPIQLVQRMPFPENEYLALPTTGTAVVRGQVFMKTRGGDVKTAAGNDVMLNPVTSYSQEWYDKSYLPGLTTPENLVGKKLYKDTLTSPDQRLFKYVLTQTAKADGSFIFKNVPAGQYFLTSKVTWEVPAYFLNMPYMETQGGIISQKITVKDGDTLEVILTR